MGQTRSRALGAGGGGPTGDESLTDIIVWIAKKTRMTAPNLMPI